MIRRINGMIESACRTNSNTTRPVPSRETDTERTIRSTMPPCTWLYTAQKWLSGASFSCTLSFRVSFSEVGRQKFHCMRGSRGHGLGAQLDAGYRNPTRVSPGSTPRFEPKEPSRARRRARRGAVSGHIQLVKSAGPMLFWSRYHQHYQTM